MPLTAQHLATQRAALVKQYDKALADLHATTGALQLLDHLITQATTPEPAIPPPLPSEAPAQL